MSDQPPRRLATIAANAAAAEARDSDIAPAWRPTTTFERRENQDYIYLRNGSPSFDPVETALAEMESGAACLVFGSGMAAAGAVFQALSPGDHVALPDVMYWSLRNWVRELAPRLNIELSFVATGDLGQLQAALKPGRTKLVWLETPANPMWTVTDIAAAADLAHGAGAKLCVDSTAATPVLTRPIELGADLVMHSATKYLNGHSDVLAGALITAAADEFWRQIQAVRKNGGAVLGSFEAWLLRRGLRTLVVRVDAASRNAMAIAEHFAAHPGVSRVLYPGLPDFPGHQVAARQMLGGFGGMLSVRVRGGFAAAARVAGATQLFRQATSLGGVESLIEHRAPVEGPDSPVPDDLLRISVGIEAVEDLIADLEQALAG